MMTTGRRVTFWCLSVLLGFGNGAFQGTSAATSDLTKGAMAHHASALLGQMRDRRLQMMGNSSNTMDDFFSSFDGICMMLELSGDVQCNCDNSTNVVSCTTPEPLCEPITGACANLEFEMNFGQDMLSGIESMKVCTNFEQNSTIVIANSTTELHNGCLELEFESGWTMTVATCTVEFAPDSTGGASLGSTSLVACDSCVPCNEYGFTTGLDIQCDNVEPMATTDGCFTIDDDTFATMFPPGFPYHSGNHTSDEDSADWDIDFPFDHDHDGGNGTDDDGADWDIDFPFDHEHDGGNGTDEHADGDHADEDDEGQDEDDNDEDETDENDSSEDHDDEMSHSPTKSPTDQTTTSLESAITDNTSGAYHDYIGSVMAGSLSVLTLALSSW